MNDNRRPMSDAAKSKVIRLHMVIGEGDATTANIQRHFGALSAQISEENPEVVNVGWVKYGQIKTEVVRDCMSMPKKIRKEQCFGDYLAKPHIHIRVSQWFERRFQVVKA